jgi:cell division protein FtsW
MNFEKFVCIGVAIVFGAQFVLNSGSATGFLPVVGISFPFLSYGGSDMLASFFLLSIINAIRRK